MTKTNSILKWILSILLVIVLALICYLYTNGSFEQRASPKDTISYKVNDLTLMFSIIDLTKRDAIFLEA